LNLFSEAGLKPVSAEFIHLFLAIWILALCAEHSKKPPGLDNSSPISHGLIGHQPITRVSGGTLKRPMNV
jgi:hypothetical protein